MLQTKAAAGNRPTDRPSSAPFACAQGCLFFESGLCRKETLGGPVANFSRKDSIYSTGDTASHCYRVLEGAVRLSRILSDGHRQILDIFLPGDTFGIELADAYAADAEAVGDVVVLKCPRACIDRRSDMTHRREMMTMLSRSLSAAQDHVAMLGHQGARERVANFLMRLAENQNCTDNEAVDLPVGRQDMADYLGLTIETTCRTLTDLKTSNVISAPNRHQIVIRSIARLEAVCQGEM